MFTLSKIHRMPLELHIEDQEGRGEDTRGATSNMELRSVHAARFIHYVTTCVCIISQWVGV